MNEGEVAFYAIIQLKNPSAHFVSLLIVTAKQNHIKTEIELVKERLKN